MTGWKVQLSRRHSRVEPLPLHNERSQFRCFGHLRLTSGHPPWEVFWACPTSRRPRGQWRTHWSLSLGTPWNPPASCGYGQEMSGPPYSSCLTWEQPGDNGRMEINQSSFRVKYFSYAHNSPEISIKRYMFFYLLKGYCDHTGRYRRRKNREGFIILY